jgi:transposase-like protein
MTQDDVLFGYRLQLFALAAERGISQACRLMGVHRSTYYRWKRQVDRQGWRCSGRESAGDRRCPTSCR